jgi:K+-transporting ATPase KdpF subunit
MNASVILAIVEINSKTAYLTGAIISILILGYLLYALIKPEKF